MDAEIRIIADSRAAVQALIADVIDVLHQRHGRALRLEFGPIRACGRQTSGAQRRYRMYGRMSIDARRARDAAQQAGTQPDRAAEK